MPLTVERLCSAYLESLNGRPSYRRYHGVYRKYIGPRFGALRASELTRLQVIEFKDLPLPPQQKRKAMAFLCQTYRWASQKVNPETHELYYDKMNPAEGIRLGRPESRERMASHEELTRIMTELPYLRRMNPKHAAFFAIRLSAPCRIKELTQSEPAHWSPCEGGGAWWNKPTSKNGKPHSVYVARQAMEYAKDLDWSGRFLFPGIGHRGQSHWSEWTATVAWTSWMRELKIQNLQLLDIRRTLASYLYRMHRRSEVDDLTIKALLNHYDGRPVAIYTRLDREYLANILQGYADWLWSLGG